LVWATNLFNFSHPHRSRQEGWKAKGPQRAPRSTGARGCTYPAPISGVSSASPKNDPEGSVAGFTHFTDPKGAHFQRVRSLPGTLALTLTPTLEIWQHGGGSSWDEPSPVEGPGHGSCLGAFFRGRSLQPAPRPNMSLPAVGRLIVACSGPLAPSPVPPQPGPRIHRPPFTRNAEGVAIFEEVAILLFPRGNRYIFCSAFFLP